LGEDFGFDGTVPDSYGVVFVDLRQGVKKQAGDVREDRGAACGDLVSGKKLVELAEGVVDALGGLKMLSRSREVVEIVGVFHLFLLGEMVGAETGLSVTGRETAATAGGGAVGATERGRKSCLEFHVFPRKG